MRMRRAIFAMIAIGLAGSTAVAPAIAADPPLAEDLDALTPPTRAVCYVGRPDDPLVARIRLFRFEDAWSVVPDETGPGRGVTATLDLTPKSGMDPKGSPPGAPLAGRAFCSASAKLGAISCSDDSGCDRADRLRLVRTAKGLAATFRGPFAFAGAGCGAAEEDQPEPPGLELPDPRAGGASFELERRPLEECR